MCESDERVEDMRAQSKIRESRRLVSIDRNGSPHLDLLDYIMMLQISLSSDAFFVFFFLTYFFRESVSLVCFFHSFLYLIFRLIVTLCSACKGVSENKHEIELQK